MTFDQLYRGGPEATPVGDCYRTALAWLIGAPEPQCVPHIVQMSTDWMGEHRYLGLCGGWDVTRLARQWLRHWYELDLASIELGEAADWARDNEISTGLSLATVPSRAHGDIAHTVVLDFVDGDVVFDPSPRRHESRPYAIDEVHPVLEVLSLPHDPEPDVWARREIAGGTNPAVYDCGYEVRPILEPRSVWVEFGRSGQRWTP